MKRVVLIIVIGVLAVAAAVAGYLYYQERQGGVDIRVDEHGVSVDGN